MMSEHKWVKVSHNKWRKSNVIVTDHGDHLDMQLGPLKYILTRLADGHVSIEKLVDKNAV